MYLTPDECARLIHRRRSADVEPVPGRPDTWAIYLWHHDTGSRLLGWASTSALVEMTKGTGFQAFHGMPRRRWRRPRRKWFWRRGT